MNSRILIWGFSDNLAGTEAVISRYVQELKEIPFDFLMYDEPANYVSLFEGGNRAFVIPKKSSDPVRYYRSLLRHMNKYSNQYYAVWCNVNSFANIDALKIAARFGIPERILHVHNAGPVGGFRTRLLDKYHERAYSRYSTRLWACSQVAGRYCYKDKEFAVIPNAIRYSEYAFSKDARAAIRKQLGVSNDCLLIGTVGRLDKQKNQEWLIRLLCENSHKLKHHKLVIVGEGALYEKLRDTCKSYNADDIVIFPGSVQDVQGYLSAFDVFVLPSLFEGLPVSLLEAQANGLPCIVSTNVTEEACISEACEYISIDDSEAWLEAISNAKRVDFDINNSNAVSFDIDHCAREFKNAIGCIQ